MLKTNKYSIYDRETLIEAFRIMDIEKNIYLDLYTFYMFIKRYGITFTKDQIDKNQKFLLENENELLVDNNDEVVKPKPITTESFIMKVIVEKF